MRYWHVYIILCVWLCGAHVFANQWFDDFSNVQQSKLEWRGDWSQFAINRNGQLQSQASSAGEGILFHASTCAINAEWQCKVRISGNCSAYNLMRFYIGLEEDDIYSNGYFVQVGGANKNITLYQQLDSTITKIIEHPNRKKCLDADASYVSLRVTRDERGVLNLYSKVEGIDTAWVEEGSTFVSMLVSQYSAVYVKNTKKRGYDFYIDDIFVTGEEQDEWISFDTESEQQVDIQLLSESFSPNYDGWEDDICFQYVTLSDGYQVTCTLYTINGVLVRNLYDNTSVSQEGTICWDGMNWQGEIAEAGVYVLHIELRNSMTNDVHRWRKAVALTL